MEKSAKEFVICINSADIDGVEFIDFYECYRHPKNAAKAIIIKRV